jgi:hypothetical protein
VIVHVEVRITRFSDLSDDLRGQVFLPFDLLEQDALDRLRFG